MKSKVPNFNSRQLLFKELFVGTLIYAVVLGFFNDYSTIVDVQSFSTLFSAAIVLEILTFLVLLLKDRIVQWLVGRQGVLYKFLLFFCVWLVMFSSKFVFIWAIDMIFGGDITISGFFGVFVLVLAVTVTHKLADTLFIRLGDTSDNKKSAA